MLTIGEILREAGQRKKPYKVPLKATVVKIGDGCCSIADDTHLIKFIFGDLASEHRQKVSELKTITIRDFKIGKFAIFGTKTTSVGFSSAPPLSKEMIERGTELISPKTPPRAQIKSIHEHSGLTTIEGTLTKVSNTDLMCFQLSVCVLLGCFSILYCFCFLYRTVYGTIRMSLAAKKRFVTAQLRTPRAKW